MNLLTMTSIAEIIASLAVVVSLIDFDGLPQAERGEISTVIDEITLSLFAIEPDGPAD